MSFGHPLLLLTLLVLPAVAAVYLWLQRRPPKYAMAYTNVDLLVAVSRGRSWRRYVPPGLALLAVAALCVAVTRPQRATLVASDNATVVLVVDVSGSMNAKDVKPTRLAAAQEALNRFLDHVPKQVKVGLVAFAGDPQVAAPPTPAKSPQTILFLSDGHQTRGDLQPLQGADLARRAGIPVYTIALGTPEGTLERPGGFGGFGGGSFGGGPPDVTQVIPVPPDPDTLRAIAQTTGGKFFEARSANALSSAYDNLGSVVGREPGKREVTYWFAAIAALLLVAAAAFSLLVAPRLP
jgi:Ca-activated chloride channel family protein